MSGLERVIDSLIERQASLQRTVKRLSNTDPPVRDNLTAVVGPAVTDDTTKGYSVTSLWVNTASGSAFICVDNTAGAAVWVEITVGGGAGNGKNHRLITKTASYTILPADFDIGGELVVIMNAGTTTTLTMPTAASAYDGVDNLTVLITVKRISSGGTAVTIDGNGSETIDNNLTVVINKRYDAITMASDGTSWWIV